MDCSVRGQRFMIKVRTHIAQRPNVITVKIIGRKSKKLPIRKAKRREATIQQRPAARQSHAIVVSPGRPARMRLMAANKKTKRLAHSDQSWVIGSAL